MLKDKELLEYYGYFFGVGALAWVFLEFCDMGNDSWRYTGDRENIRNSEKGINFPIDIGRKNRAHILYCYHCLDVFQAVRIL